MDNKGKGSHHHQADPGTLLPDQKRVLNLRKAFLSAALRTAAWAAPARAKFIAT